VTITSREPPLELAELSGDRLPVRTLALVGIETDGVSLLQQMGVTGKLSQLQIISDRCQGNPLYLRIIANTIVNTFEGDLEEFIDSDRYTYAKISNILTTQLARLTIAEKLLIYCLAIRREPVSIDTLVEQFAPLDLDRSLPGTIDSLIKRSIVQSVGSNYPTSNQVREKSTKVKRYTLQNVILEFTTDRLIEELNLELESPEKLFFFNHLSLHPTTSPEYIRDIQQRLFLQPISRTLTHRHGANTVAYLQSLIPLIRPLTPLGYGAGNMLDLAIELQADFTAWDLTDLHICEVDFQEVPLPQVNFSGTTFDRCKFAQGMGIIFDLAFSPDGELIAASGTDCQIHRIVFSPDGRYLWGASFDFDVYCWDLQTDEIVHVLVGHRSRPYNIAFTPDGQRVVTTSLDSVRVWSIRTGICLRAMYPEYRSYCSSLHRDGEILAIASDNGIVELWNIDRSECRSTFSGHPLRFLSTGLVEYSDNSIVLAGRDDGVIFSWQLAGADAPPLLRRQYIGHTSAVRSIDIAHDDRRFVSCSHDMTVRLWDVQSGRCLATMS
jgi:WD domain, G-beta repeat